MKRCLYSATRRGRGSRRDGTAFAIRNGGSAQGWGGISSSADGGFPGLQNSIAAIPAPNRGPISQTDPPRKCNTRPYKMHPSKKAKPTTPLVVHCLSGVKAGFFCAARCALRERNRGTKKPPSMHNKAKTVSAISIERLGGVPGCAGTLTATKTNKNAETTKAYFMTRMTSAGDCVFPSMAKGPRAMVYHGPSAPGHSSVGRRKASLVMSLGLRR
jgi:hypothetical protein